MWEASWQLFQSFGSKFLNNIFQELPTESKRASGAYLSTTLRNSDHFKGLKFNISLPEWLLSRLPTGCHSAVPVQENPAGFWKYLWINRRYKKGKRVTLRKLTEMVLTNLESCRRSSGEEYIHPMESLGDSCTPHGPWWSFSVTALKDGQVFQVLAAHGCVPMAEFGIHIKALGILQTAFQNILSPSDQNQWGASVSNCYQSTASKLLFLKVTFQRVFIPSARGYGTDIFTQHLWLISESTTTLHYETVQLISRPKKETSDDFIFSVFALRDGCIWHQRHLPRLAFV